jgi:hypothetical protein
VDRCDEILKKYPDFTGTDRVLFLMAETIRKVAPPESTGFYTQIVRDHPLSPLVKDAKKHLMELQATIPEPNPVALNRAQQKDETKGSFLGTGLFKSSGGGEPFKETKAASSKDPRSALAIVEGQQ